MSKTKQLTPTIAKILATLVREKISKTAKDIGEKHHKKVSESKELKELQNAHDQRDALSEKIRKLETQIEKKYSTSMMNVRVFKYSSQEEVQIRLSEQLDVSIESIRDKILLEDYFAGSKTSHDEIVDKIVKQFLEE